MLSIYGSNNDGYWNKTAVEIKLVVEKAIYQKVWIYLVMTLFVCGLILLSYRKRIAAWMEARDMTKNIVVAERIVKLKQLMEEEKLFIKSDLTISEISQRMGISDNVMSTTLNKHMKKNFYDFINEYRVEEAKKLLADPKNKNIKVVFVAYDAGFNSKATFYVAFKKATKMTPTEYQRRYLKD